MKKLLTAVGIALFSLCGICLFVNAQTKPAIPGVEEPAVAGAYYKPHDTPEMIAAALKGIPAPPAGPYGESWESIEKNYKDPDWFRDGKFGIMMHWGIYSVPAHGSEWYVRYMYGGNAGMMQWHTERYGPPTKFGYKDFLPMFTAVKWDPDAWAELFKKAGAKYVLAPGEHHDGFSNWDSKINSYNSVNYGPHRDLDGDLIKAVKKAGLKTGISDHSAFHFEFIPALPGSDEYDPNWVNFYIMDSFGAGGSFTEYYAMDYNDDVVLMGHDGPGHIAIAEGLIKVKPLQVYHGKVDKGLSVEMVVKHGEVTCLSLVEDGNGKLLMLVAEGNSVPGAILEIGNTNSRYEFPIAQKNS